MASSITARRPRSSISRMVKARTPDSRTWAFSTDPRRAARRARHSRAPPWADSRPCRVSSGGPSPSSTPAACRARCRWDWYSGVFMSAWASSQIRPIFSAALAEVPRDAGHGARRRRNDRRPGPAARCRAPGLVHHDRERAGRWPRSAAGTWRADGLRPTLSACPTGTLPRSSTS